MTTSTPTPTDAQKRELALIRRGTYSEIPTRYGRVEIAGWGMEPDGRLWITFRGLGYTANRWISPEGEIGGE